MAEEREHDVVLFGATGFTGALTAEYLARHAPEGTRWAIAGRNRSKLESVRERLESRPGVEAPEVVVADSSDPESLARAAESTRVLATTVGPYIKYGDPLVAACAEAGTDYLDLTGEPEFVDRSYVRHHERARQTGARLVHACGFDSIPHDLGALFTVGRLPEGVPLKVEGYVRAGGTFSGGTYQSALGAFSRLRQGAQAARERKQLETRDPSRKVRGIRGLPRRDTELGGYVLPMPTIDPQIVLRSARALERYGPDFSYGHYGVLKELKTTALVAGGVGGLIVAAQIPPVRSWLEGRKSSGDGPTPEQRAKGWFAVRFVGEGGGERVVCEVRGGDPGYGETAKMLSEAALCLAHDDLPETAGQVTTAQAMGQSLIDRLSNAGMEFAQLEGKRPERATVNA